MEGSSTNLQRGRDTVLHHHPRRCTAAAREPASPMAGTPPETQAARPSHHRRRPGHTRGPDSKHPTPSPRRHRCPHCTPLSHYDTQMSEENIEALHLHRTPQHPTSSPSRWRINGVPGGATSVATPVQTRSPFVTTRALLPPRLSSPHPLPPGDRRNHWINGTGSGEETLRRRTQPPPRSLLRQKRPPPRRRQPNRALADDLAH